MRENDQRPPDSRRPLASRWPAWLRLDHGARHHAGGDAVDHRDHAVETRGPDHRQRARGACGDGLHLHPGEVRHLRLQHRHLGHRAVRKSTRLNSSHTVISYAVFCLKKKKNIYKSIVINKKKIYKKLIMIE